MAQGGHGRTSVRAGYEQGATFVELFFDLAFVFAVTEVTAFTTHHLDAAGVARAALVFWLIWWGWTQWTWALNPADTNHTAVRVGTLVATGLAFLMAASVDQAYGDNVLWFAVPYIAIRLVGLGLYAWVASESADQKAAVIAFASLSLTGLLAVLAGALVDPPARSWLWLAAVLLDLGAAARAGSFRGWDIHPGHFAERHGLFVIIALGESLIVAGTTVASEDRSGELIAVAVAVVTVACLLWWTYFGWVKDALEDRLVGSSGPAQSRLARDVYSFLHFLVIGGVVGFAVGVEEIVAHPDEALPDEVLAALIVGVALFVGVTAIAYLRASGRVLVPRVLILAIGLTVAVLVANDRPVWSLLGIAVTLFVVVIAERHGEEAPVTMAEPRTRADE